MSAKPSSAIVVGGGVAGLLAALLLKRSFANVTLVERDAACGGLLASTSNVDGVPFDFGSHLISDTGHPQLDALLYDWLDPGAWHVFRTVKAGNYFNGRLNRASPFIDARVLGEKSFRQGFEELLGSAREQPDPGSDLACTLEHRFGPTFAALIHAPVLRKQLGVGMEDLHSQTPFVMKRLVCGDAEASRRLKMDPYLDERVAFPSYDDGASAALHRYPRNGGIGRWVRDFERRVGDAGVDILNGSWSDAIHEHGGRATGLTLADGRYLPCDVLVWTVPPFLLLKAAGLPTRSTPVVHRPIGLFHLVFDRPFPDENYYTTCYDDSLQTFRTTLYPNVRGDPGQGPFNCTVEVIADQGTDFHSMPELIVAELRTMGLVEPAAELLSCEVRVVPAGFPATTNSFMQAAAEQSALASAHLNNVVLLGRAKCPPFFTSDVLVEVYLKLTGLCESLVQGGDHLAPAPELELKKG